MHELVLQKACDWVSMTTNGAVFVKEICGKNKKARDNEGQQLRNSRGAICVGQRLQPVAPAKNERECTTRAYVCSWMHMHTPVHMRMSTG